MRLRTLLLVFLASSLLVVAWLSNNPATAPARAAPPVPTATAVMPQWHDTLLGVTLKNPTAEDGESGPLVVPTDAFTYTVQPQDTPWSLAVDFGRNVESLACATTPRAVDPYALHVGQVITIPALNTICHAVQKAETLPQVAAQYGVSVESITEITWNGLLKPPYRLTPGQHLLVYQLEGVEQPAIDMPRSSLPRWDAASLPFDPANPPDGMNVSPEGYYWNGIWPYGDGHFSWPVSGGRISQAFNRQRHRAIDIAVPFGSPVTAADNGTVVLAGWNTQGYGYRVVIDHNNDYLTLYAHLSNYYVKPGDVVEKGQIIGAIGSTGNSTGPHLHFELRDFGRLKDPLQFVTRP